MMNITILHFLLQLVHFHSSLQVRIICHVTNCAMFDHRSLFTAVTTANILPSSSTFEGHKSEYDHNGVLPSDSLHRMQH